MLNEEQREYIRPAYHLYVDTFGQTLCIFPSMRALGVYHAAHPCQGHAYWCYAALTDARLHSSRLGVPH
jgi:hypothetical protein